MNTERLILRNIQPEDQEDIFRGLSDPDVIEFYGVSFTSLEATAEQMEFYRSHEAAGTGKFWAVCEKETNAFLGVGGIYGISKEHKKGELGFWLLKPYWGQGYLQEAFYPILDYSFEELGLHRLEGVVEADNIRCRKAIEKFGFIYEGTLKDAEIKEGKYISLSYYACFNPADGH